MRGAGLGHRHGGVVRQPATGAFEDARFGGGPFGLRHPVQAQLGVVGGGVGIDEGVERLVKIQLDQATEAGDRDKVLASFEKLGKLYRVHRATAARRVDRTSTLPIESPRILDGDR